MHAICILTAFLSQDSRPPEFVKFEVARERVGHKVIIDASLRNPATADLADAKLTAIFYEGAREVRRSKALLIPRISAGQTASVKIEADQVQNFTQCEIYLESGALTRLYTASEASPLPALKAAGRPRLTLVSLRVAPLTLVVRNSGGGPADEPTALVTFRNSAGTIVHQARMRLEKSVGALSEETFEVTVPGVPAHASAEATLAWQASDELVLPDAQGAARELVLRQCCAVRLTDGSARVSGVLTNGTPAPVRKIQANFRLGSFEAPYELPGAIKPGATRPFVFYVPSCPAFDAVSFDLSFEGASAAEAAGDPPSLPSSRRTAARRAEGEAIKVPPPPPKAVEDAASGSELRPPSVGLRGLLVAEGSYGKNRKYSGDIYLMKMIFLDGKGKPVQPEATVRVVLYDGSKEVRKAQRSITKACWGVDATRLKGPDLDFDTIAFDRKSNELWIGIHWTDTPWAKPRADITVEIPSVGTFVFKGVEKDWETAPRYPDSK